MRKIYSLVLMTAMLFIGANAWGAAVRLVSDGAGLATAFNELNSGDTIRLDAAIDQTQCILIDDGREFILDMKGYTIDFAATTGKDPVSFKMTHGALTVIGGGTIKNSTVASNYRFEEKEVKVFALQGSTISNAENYTVLTVGPGTTVDCVLGKNGIEVDQNGSSHKAFGVCVNFAGTCHGEKYGIQLSGNVSAVPGKDDIPENAKFPNFHIQTGAWVYANSSNAQAVGVYSGGYGIWKIEGRVEGSTGVYVKGGKVEINNATITSTNTTGHGVESSKTTGVDAGGSAIVTESNNSYAGNISVTVSGSSTVSTQSPNGYAIQDTTTTSNNSEVMDVTITGGTITGGTNGGAVKIDNKTGEVVTVTGGTFTGDIQTLIDHVDDETSIIQEVVADDGQGNATVVIGKKEDGDEVADTSTEELKQDFVFVNDMSNDIVKLDATTADIVKTLPAGTTEVKYLSLTGTGSNISKVTVENGKTLKVGQIVLNANGQIVVEAGATLIVTGSNGIFAKSAGNLILRTSDTQRAKFVLSPKVTTNVHPKATVEFTIPIGHPSGSWVWQRFTSPVMEISAAPAVSPSCNSYVKYINPATETWDFIPSWSQIKPFAAGSITNDASTGTTVTYTFTGELLGNDSTMAKLADTKWNYYGNSFMAPMSTQAMLNAIGSQHVDQVIYWWNADPKVQRYAQVTLSMFGDWAEDALTEIAPMGFFVMKNLNSEAGIYDMGYTESVYNYAINGPAPAPAPARSNTMNNVNRVRINIQSESGMEDAVYALASDRYTAAFESGADVEKLMAEGMNLYVADEMNYSMLSTDDLMGTILSLQTNEDINYILTFDRVAGEVYALRDNLTNAVVLMNEGATYNFTAQPNATLDGRFQIVSRQEMPTAVETIEETVAPKAIYTVMGQYVGETTDWNNLPAGVYVVDGVKVIK